KIVPLIFRLLIPLFIILAIDWYFFQSLRTITSNSTLNIQSWLARIYWGISIFSILIAIVLLIAYQNQMINRTMFAYVMCIVFILFASKLTGSVFLVIDDIIRLFRWIFSLFSNPPIEGDLN